MSEFKFTEAEKDELRDHLNCSLYLGHDDQPQIGTHSIFDRIEQIISARGLLIAEHGEIQPTPSIPIHGDSVASTSTVHGLEPELPDQCPECPGRMLIVRPGKWQCDTCDY